MATDTWGRTEIRSGDRIRGDAPADGNTYDADLLDEDAAVDALPWKRVDGDSDEGSEEAGDTEKTLREKVLADLETRSEWQTRQATWYAMRHDGLRRKNKPWPGAADLHYPMADGMIERLKPFYFNQLFATETMAQFIATDSAFAGVATELSYWFDFLLKEESDIEVEVLGAIDKMLMCGISLMQVRWEAGTPAEAGAEDEASADGAPKKKGKLVFDAIDATRVIVPSWTKSLQDADRVTLVKTMSVEQYKRDPRWPNKSRSFIGRIAGNGRSSDREGVAAEVEQMKERREGITCSDNADEIVYWEVWEQGSTGWMVHWISPMADGLELRPSMRNPFKHGKLPMVRFEVEVKDNSHYSSRGIPERVGPFEISATKNWNDKNDYMTLCNRPIFTTAAGTPMPNTSNIKLTPGQIIPGGLSAVQMPPPPVSFTEEEAAQRSAAEQLVGMPDFGLGDKNTMKDSRTATEVDAIADVGSIQVDLKARMFRRRIGELYNIAFATALQYDPQAEYLVQKEMRKLPTDILEQLRRTPDGVRIQPNGSGDSWNRSKQLQKAIARKQLFVNSPWIDQQELDKSILELDDPRLVQRLFVDTGTKQKHEYVMEAQEIPALMLGMPLPVEPQDDHAVRIKCLSEFMKMQAAKGAPVDPSALAAIQQHLQAHVQALQQLNPDAARQISQELQMAAQGGAQPMGAPGPGLN